jgi:hypothetical protein
LIGDPLWSILASTFTAILGAADAPGASLFHGDGEGVRAIHEVTPHERSGGWHRASKSLELDGPGTQECDWKVEPSDFGKVGLMLGAHIAEPDSAGNASASASFQRLRLDGDFDAGKRSHG